MPVHYTLIKCIYYIFTRRTYLACNASAMTPLIKGVAALVPVNESVHLLLRVVVGYSEEISED